MTASNDLLGRIPEPSVLEYCFFIDKSLLGTNLVPGRKWAIWLLDCQVESSVELSPFDGEPLTQAATDLILRFVSANVGRIRPPGTHIVDEAASGEWTSLAIGAELRNAILRAAS